MKALGPGRCLREAYVDVISWLEKVKGDDLDHDVELLAGVRRQDDVCQWEVSQDLESNDGSKEDLQRAL